MDLEIITPRTVASNSDLTYSNMGGIALRNYSIVIDTSIYGKTGALFRKYLEKHFNLPLKYLIYTHYHGDHVFGGRPFKDLIPISSEKTLEYLQIDYHKEWREALENEDPLAEDGLDTCLPTICFTDKLLIRDEDLSVEVHYAGGHTSDSSFLYFPHEKVIFAGDLVFEHSFPFGGDPTCNPDVWIAQLECLQQMDAVEIIIPGHGPVLHSHSDLDKHVSFLKEVRLIIKEAIAENRDPQLTEIPELFQPSSEVRIPPTFETWLEFYQKSEC